MTIFGIHFHKWEPIYQKENYIFMGERTSREYPDDYRICRECNKVQKNILCRLYEFCWVSLCVNESKIVIGKIYRENGKLYFRDVIDPTNFKPPAQNIIKIRKGNK